MLDSRNCIQGKCNCIKEESSHSRELHLHTLNIPGKFTDYKYFQGGGGGVGGVVAFQAIIASNDA